MITLPISFNSFQSSSNVSMSLYNGSNLGPPRIAIFRALAVKKVAGIIVRLVGKKCAAKLIEIGHDEEVKATNTCTRSH